MQNATELQYTLHHTTPTQYKNVAQGNSAGESLQNSNVTSHLRWPSVSDRRTALWINKNRQEQVPHR